MGVRERERGRGREGERERERRREGEREHLVRYLLAAVYIQKLAHPGPPYPKYCTLLDLPSHDNPPKTKRC